MTPLIYDAPDEQQTHRFGLAMGRVAPAGLTVSLNGPLGAGKTRLVRAIVEGLEGSPQDVSSPTFVLLQHYAARVEVYHADAYRLTSEIEYLDLGPEEWLAAPAIVLVEWGERVASSSPVNFQDALDSPLAARFQRLCSKSSAISRPCETVRQQISSRRQ